MFRIFAADYIKAGDIMKDYSAMIDSLVKNDGMDRDEARKRVARAERLRDMMSQRGVSTREVAKLTNRSMSTVYHWRSCTFAIPPELLKLVDLATAGRSGGK